MASISRAVRFRPSPPVISTLCDNSTGAGRRCCRSGWPPCRSYGAERCRRDAPTETECSRGLPVHQEQHLLVQFLPLKHQMEHLDLLHI